ncbi:MAG: hypothetical protein AAFU54_18795 [Chloroflexota bacterium]
MGGRGVSLYQTRIPKHAATVVELDRPLEIEQEPELPRGDGDDLPYEIQGRDTFPNGRGYALLEATGRDWHIITRPAEEFDVFAENSADRFGMDEPTLSWAKDGKAVHIYVDGMSTQEFLDHVGLEIDLTNTTTASKRLSRLFRPQAATAWLDADDVSISYELSQPKFQRVPDPDNPGETIVQWGTGSGDELPTDVVEKVWDGAGVVSRDMLTKMIDQLPDDMDPRLRAKTIRELRYAKRVEFTIMTEEGQLKGHAMVSENLSTDFVIPRDLKTQVKLTDPSKRYVAFEFPHGHDHMNLDVQSAINLSPFFEGDQLIEWLEDDFEIFEESVRTGDITSAMAKLDKNITQEDLQKWALREFAASGGDINWSGSFVNSYMNNYLKRVNTLTDPESKLKLPVPGGRYYVMPAMVGRRANMPVSVGRGEVFIDHDTGTAWVNDQDWIELQDSASYGNPSVDMNDRWGIANILGGADNDDALWVHPFTDHDGERKMLLWRSPNEAGEYVTLKPTTQSSDLAWHTVDGDVLYPQADSRRLSERADRLQVIDRGLIDLNPQVDDRPQTDGTGTPLHIAMRNAAQREQVNAALLGSVCNYQMVYRAVHGTHPPERPAPLEDVIDLKKTGADGSAVADWVWNKRKEMLDKQIPIPRLLANRVSTRSQQAALTDGTHWVDRIEQSINAHVERVEGIRDEMVGDTRPPKEVFDYVFEKPEYLDAGARLNQRYSAAVQNLRKQARTERRQITPDEWESARQIAIRELERTPEQDRGRVLLGSIASVYMREKPGNDGVAWLMGPKDANGLRAPGFAQQTISEMRKIGVLSDIVPDPTGRGLIRYQVPEREVASTQTIGINGVWRNFFDYMAEKVELPSYDNWEKNTSHKNVTKKQFTSKVKQRVASYMQQVGSMDLEVRQEEWKGKLRKVVYSTRTGRKLGTIDKVDEDRYQVGQKITINGSISGDGNIRSVVQ